MNIAKENTKSIVIPFTGFYNSLFSCGVDDAIESLDEYYADADSNGLDKPLLRGAIIDLVYDKGDFQKIYMNIAKNYVSYFGHKVADILGIKNEYELFSLESLESPKFYNFETDRIFAFISRENIQKLFDINKKDNFKILKQTIDKTYTDRDGFISYYSNKIEAWLEKPIDNWDHNELNTLLCATLYINDSNRKENIYHEIYEDMISDNCFEESLYAGFPDKDIYNHIMDMKEVG